MVLDERIDWMVYEQIFGLIAGWTQSYWPMPTNNK